MLDHEQVYWQLFIFIHPYIISLSLSLSKLSSTPISCTFHVLLPSTKLSPANTILCFVLPSFAPLPSLGKGQIHSILFWCRCRLHYITLSSVRPRADMVKEFTIPPQLQQACMVKQSNTISVLIILWKVDHLVLLLITKLKTAVCRARKPQYHMNMLHFRHMASFINIPLVNICLCFTFSTNSHLHAFNNHKIRLIITIKSQ